MGTDRTRMFALGACEEAITGLEHTRARLPGEIAGEEAKAQAARDAVAAAHQAVEQAEATRRAKEAEVQDCEAKRDKFQGQTALVRTNEEYSALLREIDGMTARISQLEEEILETLEETDAAQERLALVEKEQRAVEAQHVRQAEALRAQLADVEKQLEDRAAEREEHLAALGADVQQLYHRVAGALGTGMAMIDNASCGGCHRSVPPQTINRVLAGELHTCTYCRRILVVREEH